ncbi:hypothetical protein RRG08_004398 [Elysia crispata]|uniref:Uncharacterized protein n=1 Tax=Elysia crispata TaxID=231223 RepID=A0AAE1ECR6_9GAST|nr:hypothetical protein RRG08_004398 [Elysia crispata]
MPSFNERLLFPHLCLRNVIGKCQHASRSLGLNNELKEKCENGYPAMVISSKKSYYRNIFCAYCNEDQSGPFKLNIKHKTGFKDLDLKVLMSLSTTGKYSLSVINPADITVPWLSSQCSISEAPIEQQTSDQIPGGQRISTVCATTCSNNDFTLRADGMCKAQYKALVALADDGLPPLCHSAKPVLANFIICILLPSLKHADFHPPSVKVKFDTRLNKTLYVVSLQINLPHLANWIFADESEESWRNLHRLTIVSKAFAVYRVSQNLCINNDGEKVKKESDVETIPLMSLPYFSDNYFNESAEIIRGPAVTSDIKTTVCLPFCSGTTTKATSITVCIP